MKMSRFRVFEVVVLIVALTMVCLFLHGCHSPFLGENTFVEDLMMTKDDAFSIKAELETIQKDINSLYELNDELMAHRTIEGGD